MHIQQASTQFLSTNLTCEALVRIKTLAYEKQWEGIQNSVVTKQTSKPHNHICTYKTIFFQFRFIDNPYRLILSAQLETRLDSLK